MKAEANGAVGQLDVAKVDFGDAKVKQTVSKVVKLSNTGNKDLTILKSAISPMVSVFSVNAPVDGTKIPAGGSASFTVNCIPAMVGVATAKLDITTDDPAVAGGTKFSLPLSVNGVVANVTVDPVVLDFNTPIYVGQKSEMKVVKVTNTGSVVIDNLAVKLSGDGAADFTVVTGYKTKIMPGESSEIGITFDPRTARAEIKAVAVVEADGVQVPMTVQIKGSSMSALLTVSPTTLRFRPVYVGDQSNPLSITIANDGTTPLELDVIVPPGDEWLVDLSQVKLALGPSEATKVPVVFAPKGTGSKSELIDIRMKGTVVSLAQVSAEGDGINRPMPMEEAPGVLPLDADLAGADALDADAADALGLLADVGTRMRRLLPQGPNDPALARLRALLAGDAAAAAADPNDPLAVGQGIPPGALIDDQLDPIDTIGDGSALETDDAETAGDDDAAAVPELLTPLAAKAATGAMSRPASKRLRATPRAKRRPSAALPNKTAESRSS